MSPATITGCGALLRLWDFKREIDYICRSSRRLSRELMVNVASVR